MKYLFYLLLCWLLFSCGGINKITYQRTGTSVVEAYNDEAHLTNEYQESIKLITPRLNEECDSIITKKGTIIVAEIIEKTNEIVWYKPCPEKTEVTKWIPLNEVVMVIPTKVKRIDNSEINNTIKANNNSNKKSDKVRHDITESNKHITKHDDDLKIKTRGRLNTGVVLLIVGIILTLGVIGTMIGFSMLGS